ncbi:hypothetical protein NDI45_28970 [Leptolyngbya sp. GB1-A1]
MITQQKLKTSDLHQFTGTEKYYLHATQGYVFTEGVRHLAIEGKAFWLLSAIWSYQNTELFQYDRALRAIQFWKLKVDVEKNLVCSLAKEI